MLKGICTTFNTLNTAAKVAASAAQVAVQAAHTAQVAAKEAYNITITIKLYQDGKLVQTFNNIVSMISP